MQLDRCARFFSGRTRTDVHPQNHTCIVSACLRATERADLPQLQSHGLQYETALPSASAVMRQGCDAVLALRGKIKAGGWLRTAAKGYAVPIFSVKSTSPDHLTRAVQTILGLQPSPGGLFGAPRGPDAESLPAALAPPAPDFDSSWDHDADEGETALRSVPINLCRVHHLVMLPSINR